MLVSKIFSVLGYLRSGSY